MLDSTAGDTTTTTTAETTDTTSSTPSPRPAWLPEDQWDGERGAIKDEFGQHYTELADFKKAQDERSAGLPKSPDEYKIEAKIPDGLKVPDGFKVEIDDKDPRIPLIREIAHKRGWDQDTVNDLVALDARMQIEGHTAEVARVAEEDKKLGAKAGERKAAVGNWLKGLKDKGELTAAEHDGLRVYATDAATVTALEKIMAKVNGAVPGNVPSPPPAPEPIPREKRMFPNMK